MTSIAASTSLPTAGPDDGSGVPIGAVGSTSNDQGNSSASEAGSYNISTGAIIGICVGIAVVVIGIVIIWTLWFLAKKRGWEVRKSIARASRRVTRRFDGTRSRRASMSGDKGVRLDSRSPNRNQDRDLEKGRPTIKVKTAGFDASPDPKKNRRTATIVPRGGNDRANMPPVAGRQAPAASGERIQSKFDAETPMVTSFRDKYMKRSGGS